MTFFPAVMIAAYIGGFWPGLMATLVSAVTANYYLTEQLPSFHARSVNDVVALVLFVLVGTIISALCESLHRAQQRIRTDERRRAEEALRTAHGELELRVKERTAELANARHELEERVQERTAELAAANDAFLAEIVEHKRTAEALRESQTKLQAIFDNSVDAICVSKAGNHVMVNPAYLKLFGYGRSEQLLGTSVLELIAASHREFVREDMRRRANSESAPTHYATRGLRRGGSEFDLEVEVCAYKLKGEIYTLAILRDVTERKRAEQLLRESEALKSATLESALDCIIAINHEGKVIEWNPAAEKTFGYRRAEVLGREMGDLIIPRSLRGKHRQGLARFLATGEALDGNFLSNWPSPAFKATALRCLPVMCARLPSANGRRQRATNWLRSSSLPGTRLSARRWRAPF